MTQLSLHFEKDVQALAAAGDGAAQDVLVGALSDSRAKVARAARVALAERFVVPRERLLALYAKAPLAHTRAHVLALLARGERCESMVSLLEAIVVRDCASRAQAFGHLDRWLRVSAPLQPDDVRRLAWAAWEAEDVLPADLAGRLRAYIRELRGLPARKRPAAVAAVTPKEVLTKAAAARVTPTYRKTQVVTPRSEFLRGRIVCRRYELAPTWLGKCRGLLCF